MAVTGGARSAPAASPASTRPGWRAVAVPTEHGGWGLTAEPALLGLLVRPSAAGLCIGLAGLVGFVARTPLKVVLVDRYRGRHLDRTVLATRVLAAEVAVLAVLAAGAVVLAGWGWSVPVGLAAPLVALELRFDMRSRSRRLAPELAGAVGIASVAAAVVLAGGGPVRLAVGAWLVLAARSAASIPFVRAQVARLHGRRVGRRPVDLAQLGGGAAAVASAVVAPTLALGAAAVVVVAGAQAWGLRRPPVPAKVLGLRQMGAGLAVVALAAVGVWAS